MDRGDYYRPVWWYKCEEETLNHCSNGRRRDAFLVNFLELYLAASTVEGRGKELEEGTETSYLNKLSWKGVEKEDMVVNLMAVLAKVEMVHYEAP